MIPSNKWLWLSTHVLYMRAHASVECLICAHRHALSPPRHSGRPGDVPQDGVRLRQPQRRPVLLP